MFSRVVFPLPLSPMVATYSPSSTVKFTSRRASTCTAPKRAVYTFCKCSTSSNGIKQPPQKIAPAVRPRRSGSPVCFHYSILSATPAITYAYDWRVPAYKTVRNAPAAQTKRRAPDDERLPCAEAIIPPPACRGQSRCTPPSLFPARSGWRSCAPAFAAPHGTDTGPALYCAGRRARCSR